MKAADFKELLSGIAEAQAAAVSEWHEREPGDLPEARAGGDGTTLSALALQEHLINFRLWHVEDEARAVDVGPEVIADCKRRIDDLNQRRNDLIERVDAGIVELLLPDLPADCADMHNTETLGSALDRMSILALKIYHMREEAGRTAAGPEHVAGCAEKAETLEAQREDLLRSMMHLVDEYAGGQKRPRVYYQFKMYNDPSLNPRLYGGGGNGEADE